jgi:hypothetical protein
MVDMVKESGEAQDLEREKRDLARVFIPLPFM